MSTTSTAESVMSGPMPLLGYYLPDTASSSDGAVFSQPAVKGLRVLSSLSEPALDEVQCLIADIRHDMRAVLIDCQDVASRMPLIVLADPDQSFDSQYPFGTHVSDMTTPAELGCAVFWQRVTRALQAYDQPLSVNDTRNPAYSIFKSIADQSSDWVLIKDLQHRFIVVGEPFAATAGLPVADIIGRDDLEIGGSEAAVYDDPESGRAGFWSRDSAVTDSGIASVEENPQWQLYSRKPRYRRTYRVPLKNPAGRVYALLVCSQDITEQLRNQQLLGERTAMLEQVTKEKKRADLNRQSAEDAVEAKTRFLAAASHDLRQPLHAIGLFLDSLEKRVAGTDEHHLVQQIKQSCTSLSTLFNSCLDISRLDAGVVERKVEHFSASGFLEGLDEEFRRQSRDKSLDYRLVVDDAVLYSDKILLARIVRNLLNNAVQNTVSGHVSIECRQVDGKVALSVIDTGRGLAREQLQFVFNEFHQINDNDARRGRGLGLGLSIVQRLCDLLEITIELDSQPGLGSRFTLSIPAGSHLGLAGDEAVQPVSLPEDLTVLIIEDDQYIRYGMEVLLESFGCQTLCAEDVQSAKALLASSSKTPNIVVADYHLATHKTGIQAVSEVRRYLKQQIPALLVTGDTSMEGEREAAAHAIPVLHKPVSSDELLAMINSEVRRSATSQPIELTLIP